MQSLDLILICEALNFKHKQQSESLDKKLSVYLCLKMFDSPRRFNVAEMIIANYKLWRNYRWLEVTWTKRIRTAVHFRTAGRVRARAMASDKSASVTTSNVSDVTPHASSGQVRAILAQSSDDFKWAQTLTLRCAQQITLLMTSCACAHAACICRRQQWRHAQCARMLTDN